jgi:hypothetical protein
MEIQDWLIEISQQVVKIIENSLPEIPCCTIRSNFQKGIDRWI